MRKLLLSLLCLVLALTSFGAASCTPSGTEQGTLPSVYTRVEAAELGSNVGVIWSQQSIGLWVAGTGKAMATPDIALLTFGIEAEAKSVAEAQQEAAMAMDRVMKALKAEGISEKDVQTQRFSISPVRRWIENERIEEIIGYRVTNMVVAKVRKIDKAGFIIDAVAEVGGDLTRIRDIGFTVDDPTPYYHQARENAVKDAMSKAEQIAELAKIKLGKLLYISEGTVYTPPIRDFYKAEAGAAAPPTTSISPGELEIQLNVQMVYEID